MTAAGRAAADATPVGLTPSQTVGPFLHIGLPWPDGPEVVPPGSPGGLWLRGRLLESDEVPVDDGLIETWQADVDGRFAHPDDPRGGDPGFRGFGRCATAADGAWAVHTIKPGRVPAGDGGLQAPHVTLTVFARGLLRQVVTRVYFADEEAANAEDPLLASLEPTRQLTLLAHPSEDGYRLDLRLRGDDATAFFLL